ncbi:MAG: hypothetical protein MJA83_10180 [Gammaproteobacteria bacterium]|nr:hypothetical protein [Gammaproteobacteria bacterium]
MTIKKLIDADNVTEKMIETYLRAEFNEYCVKRKLDNRRNIPMGDVTKNALKLALAKAPAVPYVSLETFREYARHKPDCSSNIVINRPKITDSGDITAYKYGECDCGLSDIEDK